MRTYWLLLGLALMTPVASEPERPGSPLPNPSLYPISDYWLRQNSLAESLELGQGDGSLTVWNHSSWLTGPLAQRGGLGVWRLDRNFQAAIGTQQGLNLDPWLAYLPFTGLRLEANASPIRVQAALGRTTTPDLPRLLGNQFPSHQMANLAVSVPLFETGAARLSATRFENDVETHTLVGLELNPRLEGPLTLEGALAQDFNSSPGDHLAYRWRFQYRQPGLEISARQSVVGDHFGPQLDLSAQRGNSYLNGQVSWTPCDELTLTEAYRASNFRSVSSPLASSNSFLSHQISWRTAPNLLMQARWQEGSSQGFGVNNTSSQDYRLRWQPGRDVSVEAYTNRLDNQSRLSGSTYQISGLAASVALGDGLSASARWERTHSQGFRFDQGSERMSLFLQQVLADNLGEIYLGASSNTLQGYQMTNPHTLTWSARLRLQPAPRWRLAASYESGIYQTRGSAEVAYLVDEHREVALTYRHDPDLLAQLQTLQPDPSLDSWGFQLRQSFGGPSEGVYRNRLAPLLTVEVTGIEGEDGQPQPLPHQRVLLQPDRTLTTGKNGLAQLPLKPGDYQVELDVSKLGPNFELEGANRRDFSLAYEDRQKLEYRLHVWSSLEAVAFNDFEGKGQLQNGYVPIPRLAFRLDATVQSSGDGGSALFRHLHKGTYQISLDPASIPAGYTTTTALAQTVELKPGQQALIPFGLRGVARLTGQLRLLGSRAPGRAVSLTGGGQKLGQLEVGRPFDLTIPSGAYELTIDPRDLGGNYYLDSDSRPHLDLKPGDECKYDFTLIEFGLIRVHLSQPVSGVAVEVSSSDGQSEFSYTDDQGVATFGRLKSSTYRIKVLAETLPPGQKAGPEKSHQLLPGAVLDVRLAL